MVALEHTQATPTGGDDLEARATAETQRLALELLPQARRPRWACLCAVSSC